jgi:hypothetical protein
MEMEAADIDTMPAGRDTDRSIRKNKLTAVSFREGVSLRFYSHQAINLFDETFSGVESRCLS